MRNEFLESMNLHFTDKTDGKKVLLIDDDARDLDHLCHVLQDEGREVFTCTDYDLGARLGASGLFDLIVVGQGGREFRGRTVIERVRELQPCPSVVVVARSVDMSCYLQAMELGVADYLETPVLREQIQQVMSLKHGTRAQQGA
jgi:DNA-binding response OmpR family regulator